MNKYYIRELERLDVVPQGVKDFTGTKKGWLIVTGISHRQLTKYYPTDSWHSEYYWEVKCTRCGRTHKKGKPYTVSSRVLYPDNPQVACGCYRKEVQKTNIVKNGTEFNNTRPNSGIKSKWDNPNISYKGYRQRILNGWSHEKAWNTPRQTNNQYMG